MLTNPDDDTPAAMKSATQSAAASPVSATIRGSVVDSSNRPLSSVNIECLGNVHCTSDQPRCTVTVNFRLSLAPDPAQ